MGTKNGFRIARLWTATLLSLSLVLAVAGGASQASQHDPADFQAGTRPIDRLFYQAADSATRAPAGVPINNDAFNQTQPAIAYSAAANTYLVVWRGERWGANPAIWGRLVTAGGTPSGSAFLISNETEACTAPDIAYNSQDGEFLVVWEYEFDAGRDDYDIYAQRVSGSGGLVGSRITVVNSGDHESRPGAVYNPDNDEYVVAWENQSTGKIHGVRVAPDGTLPDSAKVIGTSPGNAAAAPDLAYSTTSDLYLLVWHGRDAGGDYEVYGQRVHPLLVLIGGAIDISNWDGYQLNPRLAYHPERDEFLVFWQDYHWDWLKAQIYGQRVHANGSLVGSAVSPAGQSAVDNVNPDVVYQPTAHGYLLVWEYAYNSSDYDVYRILYSRTGAPLGDAGVVTNGSAHENLPAAAADGGSGVEVVWEDNRTSGSSGVDIYGDHVAIQLPTFTGGVYSGNIGDTSQPLAGATISLKCSNDAGSMGELVTSTTTTGSGTWNLPVYLVCEYYNLVETNPEGYDSVGNQPGGGMNRGADWIQYVYNLQGQTLSGNNFFDVPHTPVDTLPPGNWANLAPAGWVTSHVVHVSQQVQDTQSGLDVSTAEFDYSLDGGAHWRGWNAASVTGGDGDTNPQTIAADIDFTQDGGPGSQNQVKFRIYDMAGNPGTGPASPILIDSVPPQNPTSLTSAPQAPGTWSNNNQVGVQWSGASDDRSGLYGYSTSWDHAPSTLPDAFRDVDGSGSTMHAYVDAGDWWFHLRALDVAGNAAPAAVHSGPFMIDTLPPSASIGAAQGAPGSNTLLVSWPGSDSLSGVKGYDVECRDVTAGGAWTTWFGQTTATSATFSGVSGHVMRFHARTRDQAGNLSAWTADYQITVATDDLDVDHTGGLEVTQAVQDRLNRVVLIEKKPTFVRFHVHSHTGSKVATARLSGWHGSLLLGHVLPGNPGGTVVVGADPDRGQLNQSFWFQLPSAWLTGDLVLTAEVNYDKKLGESDYSDNTAQTSVSFQYAPPMNLLMVDACYKSGTTTYHVRSQDFNALASWLRRAYPINQLNTWEGYRDPCYDSPPSASTVNNTLTWNKGQKVLGANEDPWTRYYGLVDDGWWRTTTDCWMRGLAVGVPSTVASGPSGDPARCVTWDTDNSYADWYGGHELGHTYNQAHTRGTAPTCWDGCATTCNGGCGCEGGAVSHYSNGDLSSTHDEDATNALYGFDTLNHTVYPPAWKDVMTYCDDLWISDYTYTSIRTQMLKEKPAAATAAPVPSQSGEYLAVFGTIVTPTDQVTLAPFYRVPDAWDWLGRVPGPYSIRLLDGGGGTLADYPFTPRSAGPDPGQGCAAALQGVTAAPVPASIAEYVPWVDGTARVGIFHGAAEIAGRAVSANPPAVTVTTPSGGRTLAGQTTTVRWSASDPDGDPLVFTVQYSADGGATWNPLASDLTGTSLEISTDRLAGTTQGIFRILATDGVNTSSDTSDGALTVAVKPPTVQLISPLGVSTYIVSQTVSFQAEAHDVQDGPLADAALTWTSDLSGVLGTGRSLALADLPAGTHHVTVTAANSHGLQAQATTTVIVAGQGEPATPVVYLPMIRKRAER